MDVIEGTGLIVTEPDWASFLKYAADRTAAADYWRAITTEMRERNTLAAVNGHAIARLVLTYTLLEIVGDRVKAGGLPQGTPVPSLVVTSVGDTSAYGIRGAARLTTELVQVTIRAEHPEQRIDLSALVLRACDGVTGTMAGFAAVDVISSGKGPDFTDDADVWLTSRDFRVTFRP
jgi:hypothetical protein